MSAASQFARQQQSLQSNAQPFAPGATTASSISYSAYNQTPGSNYAPASRNLGSAQGQYPGAPAGRMLMNGNGGGSRSASGPGQGGLKPQGSERKGDSREVARTHWAALKDFLASWLKEETPSARASAREKLTRLTKLQFQELSTDVYDELMRRIQVEQGSPEEAIPFLPVRDDFHPKRNQARQKLATLPRNRFKDLASDVYFELKRRYPEFEEEERDEKSYAEPPPAPGPAPRPSLNSSNSSSDPQYRQRVNPTPPPLNRLQSNASGHQRSASRNMSASSSNTHRTRPSRDEKGDEMERLVQGPERGYGTTSSQRPGQRPVGATSDMVVPNKSRMREEEIEVPYARDSVLEVGAPSSRSRSRASGRDGDRDSQMSAGTSISNRQAPIPPANSASSRPNPQPVHPNDTLSPTMTDDREYYDRMSFSSNVTGKSRMMAAGQNGGWDEEREQKIRQEYEFRVAGLERKLGILETERDEARRAAEGEREKREEWEAEVRGLKERATTHASSLRSVQHELDIARDAAETARRHAETSSRQGEDELSSWRNRCDGLEDEMRRLEEENASLRDEVTRARSSGGGGGGDGQAVAELKTEIHSLVDELNTLSAKNDELMVEREQDAAGMNEMEARVEEFRRKYEAVRIELRNLKATSTMFVSKPLSDDHLPASPDGNIADVNVSAFQTAIDGLLAAARSSAPSGVLPAMKAIVEAVTEIGEDVKSFEAKPNLDVDSSRLESLKHESTTRLSALMQAARNHAMASGLSPVSLLDGAAGHLSANVVEIIKLLKIRRTARRSRSSLSIRDMVGRDAKGANGNFDREYGTSPIGVSVTEPTRPESRTQTYPDRGPSVASSRPPVTRNLTSERHTPSPANSAPNPPSAYFSTTNPLSSRSLGEPGNHLRANVTSYQSTTSQARSDSFDLERKASVASNPRDQRPVVESRNGFGNGYRAPPAADDRDRAPSRARGAPTPPPSGPPPSAPLRSASGTANDRYAPSRNRGRSSEESEASSQIAPVTARSGALPSGLAEVRVQDDEERSPGVGYSQGGKGGSEEEWEELKPYLNAQSSALVNSIQNLLAAIRTNQQTPALTEHLSEVIAIASSIVAVAGNALPTALRFEGEGLLKGLVSDTNKLSEAQEAARGAGFGKDVRQGIAAASFGVAKGLKSLMKLGVE